MSKILAVESFCNLFVFPNSQGSAATQLRCAIKYHLYIVGNFMLLQQRKIVKNMLRFDKVTVDYKTVPFFFGHGVYLTTPLPFDLDGGVPLGRSP